MTLLLIFNKQWKQQQHSTVSNLDLLHAHTLSVEISIGRGVQTQTLHLLPHKHPTHDISNNMHIQSTFTQQFSSAPTLPVLPAPGSHTPLEEWWKCCSAPSTPSHSSHRQLHSNPRYRSSEEPSDRGRNRTHRDLRKACYPPDHTQ